MNNASVIKSAAGASHITNGPLTTSLTREAAPGLLLSELDSRVVKVRPSATPIDQISRMANHRRAGAMKVGYYLVDTRPTSAKASDDVTLTSKGASIKCSDAIIFEQTETVLFPTLINAAGQPVVGYVTSKNDSSVKVTPVNLGESESVSLTSGTEIVRMGRAATELDVQTASFEALPVKSYNYCQIFKAQIEESTLQRMTNKEVGWTFSDQEEVAVIDMRMGMEKNFLFGVKAIISDPQKKEDVMLTEGIWHQAGKTMIYNPASKCDEDFVISMTRQAFAGHAGSRRKVLIGGSDLIDRLNRIDHQRVFTASDTITRWGIDFTELRSKFGSLYVVHSETFDNCGMPGNGIVIDPQYMTKYSFIPMTAERLDLKRSGQRNTDAVVITEGSCLVLRYPDAHMRIIARAAETTGPATGSTTPTE